LLQFDLCSLGCNFIRPTVRFAMLIWS
jgi:hypothetical protein